MIWNLNLLLKHAILQEGYFITLCHCNLAFDWNIFSCKATLRYRALPEPKGKIVSALPYSVCIYFSIYVLLSHSNFRILIICVLPKKEKRWERYCRNATSRFINKPLSVKALEVFYFYILHLAFEKESQLLSRVKGNEKKKTKIKSNFGQSQNKI